MAGNQPDGIRVRMMIMDRDSLETIGFIFRNLAD